jgi:hypothetical protein
MNNEIEVEEGEVEGIEESYSYQLKNSDSSLHYFNIVIRYSLICIQIPYVFAEEREVEVWKLL